MSAFPMHAKAMAPTATTLAIAIFAQAPEGYWVMMMYALLAGALVLGAVLIALASRWRRGFREKPLSPSDQLAQYRSLYDQGAISEEEYHRLRGLLGSQLRQELQVPPKPKTEDGAPRTMPAPQQGSHDLPPGGSQQVPPGTS